MQMHVVFVVVSVNGVHLTDEVGNGVYHITRNLVMHSEIKM
jgi:hypothetical protein